MAKILVAEDEHALAELIARVLRAAGHTVELARDGNEAWNLLEQGGVDIVLSDLLMPELSGYGLLEKMRADERFKEVPCLVLSNSGQIDDLNRAYEVGANAVLIKANFNPSQVIEQVNQYLGN